MRSNLLTQIEMWHLVKSQAPNTPRHNWACSEQVLTALADDSSSALQWGLWVCSIIYVSQLWSLKGTFCSKVTHGCFHCHLS